jgi:hypothetical protein
LRATIIEHAVHVCDDLWFRPPNLAVLEPPGAQPREVPAAGVEATTVGGRAIVMEPEEVAPVTGLPEFGAGARLLYDAAAGAVAQWFRLALVWL